MRLADEPLHTRDVAELAADLVGRVLSESTVRNCLAEECRGRSPALVRVRAGVFVLSGAGLVG